MPLKKIKSKLSPAGGRTIYNKYPQARKKASAETIKKGGMRKDRLDSGYTARRKDVRSIIKMGKEALKPKILKKK